MEEYQREIELIDYIEVLLKYKYLIIAVALVCAISAALFERVRRPPPAFKAESLVVLSQAIAKEGTGEKGALGTEIVMPEMAAQTYQALAKSDELLQSLLDSLSKADLAPGAAQVVENLSLVGLSGMLEAELLQQTAGVKSPLLAFRVHSAEESLPVDMVNLWAALFVRRHHGLSSNYADSYYQWVQEQYEVTSANLGDTETRLREIKASYHTLNMLQSEIDYKTSRLNRALSSHLNVRTQLEVKKSELIHLNDLLTSLESDGQWIGYLSVNQLSGLSRKRGGSPDMRRNLIELRYALDELERDSLEVYAASELKRLDFEARKRQADRP